jgi:hypothetical protein
MSPDKSSVQILADASALVFPDGADALLEFAMLGHIGGRSGIFDNGSVYPVTAAAKAVVAGPPGAIAAGESSLERRHPDGQPAGLVVGGCFSHLFHVAESKHRNPFSLKDRPDSVNVLAFSRFVFISQALSRKESGRPVPATGPFRVGSRSFRFFVYALVSNRYITPK